MYSCDYEEDFCNMTQLSNDKFDWTRHEGSTDTAGTGPDSAQQGQYYMYTEASGYRSLGDQSM